MKNLVQQEWSDELSKSTNGVILDVRTAIEVEDGKIPGATNIDIFKAQEFIDALEKLDKNLPYFVYCRAGSRSAQACAVMHQMGFEYTYNLEGGFSEWSGDVEL